jgi:hypothetical protein
MAVVFEPSELGQWASIAAVDAHSFMR